MKNFFSIFNIIPIMMYYLIESIVIGIPIWLIWKYLGQPIFFNFEIPYITWVGVIWILKTILFDVFKNHPTYTNSVSSNNQEEENN